MASKTKALMILERQLQRKPPPRTDVEAVIRAFTHDDIKLTAPQQRLCDRLLFVDAQLRMRKHPAQAIVRMTMKKFGVSRFRAEMDITDAMKVFGETRKLNKAYLLSHQIIEIQRQIQTCIEKGAMELLPKLNDNLTYALNSLPPETERRENPPAQIIFVLNENKKTEDLADIIAEADALIKTPTDGDYIEFREDSDNPGAEPATDDGSAGSGE